MKDKINDKNLTVNKNDATFSKSKKGGFRALKFIVLLTLFIVSYAVSYYLNGFEKTNNKLLTLLIFAGAGFLVFYLIYYVAYIITAINIKNKSKRKSKMVINCDEETAILMQNEKYIYSFDKSLTVTENLKNDLTQAGGLVEDVADTYSKGGRYAFLNYTVYDALDVFSNAVDVLYDKIDGFLSSKLLSALKLYDKPITLVSKELNKLLYDEQPVTVTENTETQKPEKLLKVKEKFKAFTVKASVTVFQKPINNFANGITEFIASESVRVFGKNGKKRKIKKAVAGND